MKNTIALLVLLGVLLALSGCARAEHSPSPPASGAVASTAVAGDVGVTALAPSGRSLITTIQTSVTVDDVEGASERLRAAVEKAGGFVADARTSGADGQVSAQLELRVPADKARSLRATIGELGSVTSSTEKKEDVTEQRADLEARLRNARMQEKRLLELMSDRTASIRDVVEAEKELARVRENVERLEAQQLGMKSRIDLATVHVSLSTKNVPAWKTPGTSILRAGKSGVEAAEAVSVCFAMAMAATAPTLLPIAAVIAAIVVVVRRRRAQTMSALLG